MIDARGLGKSFQRAGRHRGESRLFRAAYDISFEAPDGAITGLLGPNGAGKSTTLRMLATLVKPDTGTAIIDGSDICRDSVRVRTHLGFMPHDAGIYPRLTARENILYYARLCGLDRPLARVRADALIEQLGMQSFATRRAQGFSQGQKTKVALARALVHEPRTVLLDEPTNGLDIMATRSLREILRELARQGHCILFSSHIMQEVVALCDRVAIISEGTIAMTDSLAGIRQRTGTDDFEEAFVRAIGAAP